MSGLSAILGGGIGIRLTLEQGAVASVDIRNDRPLGVAQALAGTAAMELPARVGGLFSLCRRAQTIAALQSVEAALGVPSAADVEAAREALRLAELLTQTAMRLALHWPDALGLAPDPGLVRACLEAERALVAGVLGMGWDAPGAGSAAPTPELRDLIDDLAGRVGRFVTSERLFERIVAADLRAFGGLSGTVEPEHGPLRRMWNHPEIARIRASDGPGLAARLQASLVELAALPDQIRTTMARVRASGPRRATRRSGTGRAQVETARGPLCHRVRVARGIVADVVIDAPTEANFRPGGPVDTGLQGACEAGLGLAARLHVLAIDPCVEFTVEIADA